MLNNSCQMRRSLTQNLCVLVTEGEVSLKYRVNAKMAPFVQVIVFAVLPSETVIAKSNDFATEKCFSHQVRCFFTGISMRNCHNKNCLSKTTWSAQINEKKGKKLTQDSLFPSFLSSGLNSASLPPHLKYSRKHTGKKEVGGRA